MNFQRLALLAVVGASVALLQSNCQTSTWNVQTVAGSNTSMVNATLYEHDVVVIPPDPPFSTEYTVYTNIVPLEDRTMDDHYTQDPATGHYYYLNHQTGFGPHLPDRSALTFARYRLATEVEMVSDEPSGPVVTTDQPPPADWATCLP